MAHGSQIPNPSRAVEDLPKHVADRLYFSSSTHTGHIEKRTNEIEAGENFQQIFDIGSRDTRYMLMPQTSSHLPGPEYVKYRRDFGPVPPNLDFHDNKKLAALSLPTRQKVATMKVEVGSRYAESFQRPTSRQMRSAKQDGKEAEPGVYSNRVLGGPGKWMRFSSHNEEHFSSPPSIGFQSSAADMPQRAKIEKTSPAESWLSTHRRAFPEVASEQARRSERTVAHTRPGRVDPKHLHGMFNESKEAIRKAYSMPDISKKANKPFGV